MSPLRNRLREIETVAYASHISFRYGFTEDVYVQLKDLNNKVQEALKLCESLGYKPTEKAQTQQEVKMKKLHKLIIQSHALIHAAGDAIHVKRPDWACKELVKLRGLLNEQPELEAGGACESSDDDET